MLSINLCKNLILVLANLEEIISFRPNISNLTLEALQNVGETGNKTGLDTARDQLAILLLRNLACYHNFGGYWNSEEILKTLHLINFNSLSKKSTFKSIQGLAILISYLLNSQTVENQLYVINIIRVL